MMSLTLRVALVKTHFCGSRWSLALSSEEAHVGYEDLSHFLNKLTQFKLKQVLIKQTTKM